MKILVVPTSQDYGEDQMRWHWVKLLTYTWHIVSINQK